MRKHLKITVPFDDRTDGGSGGTQTKKMEYKFVYLSTLIKSSGRVPILFILCLFQFLYSKNSLTKIKVKK